MFHILCEPGELLDCRLEQFSKVFDVASVPFGEVVGAIALGVGRVGYELTETLLLGVCICVLHEKLWSGNAAARPRPGDMNDDTMALLDAVATRRVIGDRRSDARRDQFVFLFGELLDVVAAGVSVRVAVFTEVVH